MSGIDEGPLAEAVSMVRRIGTSRETGLIEPAHLPMRPEPGAYSALRSGGVLGTAIVRACGVTAAVTGLSERHARAVDLDVSATYIQASSHARLLPGRRASGR
jgi:hypothetical protein